MDNHDFSKVPHKKNYNQVLKQQGRVPLDVDSDANSDISKNQIVNAKIDLQVKAFIQNVNTYLSFQLTGRSEPPKGFRALFYGPPNTEKTLTAEAIAKHLKKELYKVDLSIVVSKFIVETEKNLEALFARAEDKGWVLFFDEADALFDKRTDVRDSHDRYANQDLACLLERISKYDGLIILSIKGTDIDKSVQVLFDQVIGFPLTTT